MHHASKDAIRDVTKNESGDASEVENGGGKSAL